ncbi:GH25 family lysozyme [Kineothrix sp. MB12-C1]|uniref:GH25 family lysozyme n=1 Tax=Kineothrix sp. MB12-C1 TaxID=3070215 RepID=UPI0027D2E73B|nr:GH25 family lysozyme [Kineothrix sp. MB12-C1]WMC93166.1 GH25 family lysozyme [Kineothrix sp. MB12-C1]
MSTKVNNIIQHFENLYKNKAIYLWGANAEIITPALCDKLHKTYGNSTYNKTYYENKLKEGLGRIGADCSGALFPVSGFDTTAQNYYSKCYEKGVISSLPRNKACLVFKGSSASAINHVGFYCGNGHVIEMKSSKDNCVKATLDGNGWKWYGIPTWIDYSSTGTSNTSSSLTAPTSKCIDVSSYQGNVDWKKVKSAGMNKAILKIIRKDLTPDKKFEEYYLGCKETNIDVIGVYNYSYATTAAKAKIDAQKVLSVLNGRRLKIWLDVEDKCQQGLGATLKDIINAYQEVIESAGYDFGVYTGMSFYTSYIKPYISQIKCNDWWIARYYNSYNKMDLSINPNEQYNPKNTIAREIYAWQYTSSGQVPGIIGNVDINILYNVPSSNTNNNTPNTNTDSSTSNSFTETSITFLGKITTASTNLTIRSQPNTGAARLGHYAKDSVVQLLAKTSNGWYRTDKGYISGDYVSTVMGQVYNCGGLNFRTTYSSDTSANIIKALKSGEEMTLLREENGWYQSKLNDGTVGWVSKKYIRMI